MPSAHCSLVMISVLPLGKDWVVGCKAWVQGMQGLQLRGAILATGCSAALLTHCRAGLQYWARL